MAVNQCFVRESQVRQKKKKKKNEVRIQNAAAVSHNFVGIHPYDDGNGRVSRLLMNLVAVSEHPCIYLKADKKGRRRYFYALRRADRGDRRALACLICINLIDIYERMINALRTSEGLGIN